MNLLASFMLLLSALAGDPPRTPVVLRAQPPEIPHQQEQDWVNSKPLKLADLRGQVVVLNFWTFG